MNKVYYSNLFFKFDFTQKCERTKKNWTFKDIYRTSKATANSLLNKLKLEKGNHFAIVLPNGAEHPILLLAGSMSGLVPTTINPSYTASKFFALSYFYYC